MLKVFKGVFVGILLGGIVQDSYSSIVDQGSTQEQPKVSVIVPSYNSEKYMRRCLDSLVNQTLKDIEVICINDASTDSTLDILKEYALKDSRIKIIDLEKNQGAAVARNKGLDVAHGEYIAFVDSDDSVELTFYSELCRQVTESKPDVIRGGFKWHLPDGRTELSRLNEIIRNKGKYFFTCEYHAAIYKRSFLAYNKIRFPDECIKAQDVVFLTRVMLKSPSLVLTDSTCYQYYRRNDSLDGLTLSLEKIKSQIIASELRFKELNNTDFYDISKSMYVELFMVYFGCTAGLINRNNSYDGNQVLANALVSHFHMCKDTEALGRIFTHKWMLPYIKSKDVDGLANRLYELSNTKPTPVIPLKALVMTDQGPKVVVVAQFPLKK